MHNDQEQFDAVLQKIEKNLGRKQFTHVAGSLAKLDDNQVVDLLERLDLQQRALVYRMLPKDRAVEVFDELDPTLQGDLVLGLKDEEVASVFEAMDPDDRAGLLDELPASVARRLLHGLPVRERNLTAVVLGYPEGSIGRRMSPEVVSLRLGSTVQECMDRVYQHIDDAETIYVLPVVDRHRRVRGITHLRELMQAKRGTLVDSIMDEATTVRATSSAEHAARLCADRGYIALTVVDAEERLLGILTVDDALEILEDANSEDQARMSGSEPLRRPYFATPVWSIVRARVVWLLVLAIGATFTVQVLEVFQSTLASMVVLTVFVPLLIGTGGNTGNQAATTVTRAIALGEVRPRDVLRVAARELRVGFVLGLLLGSLGFVVASLFYGFNIGTVIGFTLLSICTIAATLGGVMPLLGKAIHVDPAVFANPFISTLLDATGLVIYFLIARAILHI